MQDKMPVVDMLVKRANEKVRRLHMPGHKGGNGFSHVPGFDALAFDVTELPGTDDLFDPRDSIKEAMELAAAGFGAKMTRFLTAGATSGVLAMLLALEPGSQVVVARDCHRSVAAGIELGRLRPFFVTPGVLEGGLPGCVTAGDVENALRKAGRVSAVILTYPNYYGLGGDLMSIRRAADSHGALLLVDGAHGTHFACGAPGLPPYAGLHADVWVDGAHKTISAMGQGAFLHMGARAEEKGMTKASLLRALSLVHTSSPSYPVMASLDAARQRLFARGWEWAYLARACGEVSRWLDGRENLCCPCLHHGNRAGVAAHDPTRLVVDVRGRGLTGYAAQPILKAAGVEPEMCDNARIVGIAAPWDAEAVGDFAEAANALPQAGEPILPEEPPGLPGLPARTDQTARGVEHVETWAASGRIAAVAVGAYPPGIPALWPGEPIDDDMALYLTGIQECGGRLFGLQDGKLPVYEGRGDVPGEG